MGAVGSAVQDRKKFSIVLEIVSISAEKRNTIKETLHIQSSLLQTSVPSVTQNLVESTSVKGSRKLSRRCAVRTRISEGGLSTCDCEGFKLAVLHGLSIRSTRPTALPDKGCRGSIVVAGMWELWRKHIAVTRLGINYVTRRTSEKTTVNTA